LALTAFPAVTILKQPFAAMAQAPGKPNSTVNGVNLGTITYSYRSMPDQSAEAILRYVLDSGISRIEFMGGPVEAFAGAPQAAAGRGGGRRGQQPTSEQQTAQREAADRLRAWRTSVSMDRFKALRKMFNDAGVAIYAWKQLTPNMSDAEMEYVFNVAEALGCTHTTLELVDDAEQLRRIGQMAEKKKIYAAYHTHLQGSMTAFDQAFAVSKGNMANVDLGHFVAAGGDPVAFIKRFNGRISSVHLKDRTTPANGQRNLSWGEGDTPLKEILLTMKRDKHTYPAAIELEYQVPSGSDAVKETVKCLDFCKAVLANA
jgi:sugar phosphate isomerase/epimerase